MFQNRRLDSNHPLFRILRNGLLWHCTGLAEFQQIWADGAIKPNDGRVNKWGNITACQYLTGVSVFDFSTRSEQEIFEHSHKWGMFLGIGKPLTIALGIEKSKSQQKLVPYPENRDRTAESVIGRIVGGPIPMVETCYCGPIATSEIVTAILINPEDCSSFHVCGSVSSEMVIRDAKKFISRR